MDDENQPDKLGVGEAETLIRRLSEQSENVRTTKHVRERLVEREIRFRQVLTCLRKGAVTEGPFLNGFGNWQVTITRLAAGQDLSLAVAIEWPNRLIVITAF